MFQDGRHLPITPTSVITSIACLGPGWQHSRPGYNTRPTGARLRSGTFSPAAKTDVGPAARVGPPAHEEQGTQPAMSEQLPFPFNNFTCSFTLFSKCFSSFHHCTCSLSVSRLYLALDGVYHPLGAAFPNNSTPRARPTRVPHARPHGALTLSGVPFQGTYATLRTRDCTLHATTRLPTVADFKSELLPLHSPLLGQSRLVSFPPLIDMLKFSG